MKYKLKVFEQITALECFLNYLDSCVQLNNREGKILDC